MRKISDIDGTIAEVEQLRETAGFLENFEAVDHYTQKLKELREERRQAEEAMACH